MSFKKIVLTSLLLTALNTNADTQNAQQTPALDIQLIRLQKEVELQQKKSDYYQNKIDATKQKLSELLHNNQSKNAREQEEYDQKIEELIIEVKDAETSLAWTEYYSKNAKENLYAYEHPIKSVMIPAVAGLVAGAVVLGTAAGVNYLTSK